MTSHERLLVMSFDEGTIDPRVACDSTNDAVYGPNDKIQVVMVRSLCSHWKQPVFFDSNNDALAYVAGYVAAKCATVDSTLGKITSDASEVPRDERYAWIDTISRGGLTVPSAWWLEQVEQLEELFTTKHGGDIDRGPGVVRQLAEAAARKFPQLHPRVLRRIRNPDAPPVSDGTRRIMARRRAALRQGDETAYRELNRQARAAIQRDSREDEITATPASYTALTSALQARLAQSRAARLSALLRNTQLGDQKPTQLLLRMRSELGEKAQDSALLRTLFLQRLPRAATAALSLLPEDTSLS
ncbi:Transposable element P transposase [Amphibalanus amphitrite]|uniref:Transposable element P transposase n=1 Tax=Amphibalanus amphitrite TaxID=1232801 RepID=A0A6A4W1V4_AMPAM|nr:Transposable element P transposase [Amphibalanus amphitrite]